jgi:hypothetical protein
MIRFPKTRKTPDLASLLFLGFLFFSLPFSAQEVLRPLGSNDVIKSWLENLNPYTRMPVTPDTIPLPFRDDFSKTNIYPDAYFWIDSTVYVNRHMGRAPITLGVATFDGLSKTGAPYDTVTTVFSSLPCDTLTSKKIYLSFPVSDSIYLSFFYQPRGFGDLPEPGDSLILQFRSPVKPWTRIWSKAGFAPGGSDTSFFRVMIPIKDTSWLKNGFQFRFINYGSRQGNVDHWHLDYVYLNRLRSVSDTIMDDVAFVYTPPSFLSKYTAMPWNQYNASEMAGVFKNYIRNNFNTLKNTTYEYRIFDQNSVQVNTTYTGTGNIDPFRTSNYTVCTQPTPCLNLNQPTVNYSFPNFSNNTYYTIQHVISANPDINRQNDTLRFTHRFANYYAYDDGTAELAYGLNVIGGKLAYKFTLNVPDTIRAVDMYFNWVPNGLSNPPVNSVTQRSFRITIWSDMGGVPGAIIFQDSITTPNYHFEKHNDWGNLMNQFYRYHLTSPVLLSGTFYVGWVQYTKDLLNVGFDLSRNSSSKVFYNTSGSWQNSIFSGSLMIRPVFGTPAEALAHSDETNETPDIILYPNPGPGPATLSVSGGQTTNYNVFNSAGVLVRTGKFSGSENIDFSNLPEGLYFISGISGSYSWNRKFILIR